MAARVLGQVVAAMAKLGEMVAEAMVRGRPPLLVRVRVCEGAVRETPVAGKLRVVGESETPGGATPVPMREMVLVRN